MAWISENWIWLALIAGVVWLYFRGNLAGRLMNRAASETPPHVRPTSGAEQAASTGQVDPAQTQQHRHHGCC